MDGGRAVTKHLRLLAIIISAVLAGTACQPPPETRGERFAQYREPIRAKWTTVRTVGEALMTVERFTPTQNPERPFHRSIGDGNVAFFPADHFFAHKAPAVKLDIFSPLSEAIKWIGGDYYWDEDPVDDDFVQQLDRALATPYAGFYGQADYQEARMISENTFEGGHLTLNAAIIEIDQKSVVATCSVTATPEENIEFVSDDGKASEELLEILTRASMVKRAARLLAECLSDQTGGDFYFSNT